jgi:uncharacterized protein involved in type VI secretion and phage assembly
MGYSQSNKLLQIQTILDSDPAEKKISGDPLLLTQVDGTEGMSKLFSYDVVMLREAGGIEGNKRPTLDPHKLIGTQVKFGVRQGTSDSFQYRVGMFESFEEVVGVDITHLAGFHVRDFLTYRARIVPWVSVLTRDLSYRVFEGATVGQILTEITDEAKKAFPNLLVDIGSKLFGFPTMDYCVQFGESTYNFMSRIMARFGIFYWFDHRTSDEGVLNDTMIFRTASQYNSLAVSSSDVTITDDEPNDKTIAKVVRRFRPPPRRVVVGGFNELDPKSSFVDSVKVAPQSDFWSAENVAASKSQWFAQTNFGEPVTSGAEATALAGARSYQSQLDAITLTGISRNATFMAGRTFEIQSDDDDDPDDIINQAWLMESVTISCHDYNYINLWGWQALDTFFSTFSTPDADSGGFGDVALAKVAMWVSNNAQNQISPILYQSKDPSSPGPINFGTAWAAQLVSTMGWLLVQSIDINKMLKDNKNQAGFAVSFIACGTSSEVDFPLPAWERAIARGPHTAVVIGPDGAKASNNDIFCDAIGRVRVRFPWDPGPPSGDSELPPLYPVAPADQPYQSGGNTCWMRVAEGWAGSGFGTQFLPRIGQEVLVSFLNGDPERPVIVGRMYNADIGSTNLPFVTDDTKKIGLNQTADLPNNVLHSLPWSGIKTRSTPSTDSDGKPLAERFNLLRFDDTRGKEQYLLRSQGRFDKTVLGTHYETTSGDQNLTVGWIDTEHQVVGGNQVTKVFQDYHLHVGDPAGPFNGGHRYETVEKDSSLHVKKNADIQIDGNWSLSVGGKASISADTIVLKAVKSITVIVGTSIVVVQPEGVYIEAAMHYDQCGASGQAAAAASITEPKDPVQADPGTTCKAQ